LSFHSSAPLDDEHGLIVNTVLFANLAETIVFFHHIFHQSIADFLCRLAIALTHHPFKLLTFLFVAAVVDRIGIEQENLAERFEGLDMLINNAGATHIRPMPIADATDEIYDWTFAVNTKGTFLCLREAVKNMRSGGRIVNLSSTGVFHAHPGYAIYSAAKSAVEVLTRVLCKELEGRNITVNCVAPGATATEQWLEGKSEELLQTIANLSPLNRLGTPEDIAGLVAFLVSSQGEWVNGQVIRVNGGFA
jgi:3-oxoacyl-[acyl-carrier protein] reductase